MPKFTEDQQLAIDKDKTSIIVSVKAGSRVSIINNPACETEFTGWTVNGNLFDLSRPITNDIILDASYE